MTKEPVLIVGGRSDIGRATAHRFAAAGHPIQLAARDAAAMADDKADIELRYGVAVSLHELDVLDLPTIERCLDELGELPVIAVCAVGLLGDQAVCEKDLTAAATVMRSNYEGPALVLAALAKRFEARGSGTLVGISSVAGERGRAINYVYGSAKAGFSAFLSGLRNRLCSKGVHVITILPGFVITKMTEHMDLPATLTATPEVVATAIERAVRSQRDVVYVKSRWALVMLIIRNIPERMFKRMKI